MTHRQAVYSGNAAPDFLEVKTILKKLNKVVAGEMAVKIGILMLNMKNFRTAD